MLLRILETLAVFLGTIIVVALVSVAFMFWVQTLLWLFPYIGGWVIVLGVGELLGVILAAFTWSTWNLS